MGSWVHVGAGAPKISILGERSFQHTEMPMSSHSKETINPFVDGPIVRTLLLTSLAMIPGTLAMSIFNIVDTYFVSRLGTAALAAMGYCFPVMMIINCVYHGFTTGIMTLLSHAIGRKDDREVARILGLGSLLIAAVSLVLGIGGSVVARPIFAHFVQTPEVLELTLQFINIWLLGNLTISLGLMSNKVLLALGCTRHAAFWMVYGIILNVFMEPLFIFGYGSFPALGMTGAALATVLAQSITPLGSFYIIQKYRPFLNRTGFDFKYLAECWKNLTLFSMPAILSMLIMPIGGLIMTWIASQFGDDVVAGIAAAQRLETLAFVIPMSLGISLAPMIAQNYAAKKFLRVNAIRKFSFGFALVFLMIAAFLMTFFAENLVGIFTTEPQTLRIGTLCLRIVSWGFAAQEIFRFSTFIYNSCNRPKMSAWYNIFRMFALAVPLSMLALLFHDITWLFIGRLLSDILATVIIWYTSRRLVLKLIQNDGDET